MQIVLQQAKQGRVPAGESSGAACPLPQTAFGNSEHRRLLGRKAPGASHPAQPWAAQTPSGNAARPRLLLPLPADTLHPSGGAGAPGGKDGAQRKGISEGAEHSTPYPQLGADPRHLWMLPAPLSPAGKGPVGPEGSWLSQAGATFVLSIPTTPGTTQP